MTISKEKLNLALPDGHLMSHVLKFFDKIDFKLDGYRKNDYVRRPVINLSNDTVRRIIPSTESVFTKVIRPQDMPTHVANANFDLAISGVDWLSEHKLRFPNSPVVDILKMGYGKVRIVAAAHQDIAASIEDFKAYWSKTARSRHIRVATEYVYIADHFMQTRGLKPYKIIMTYGATESLIPEDADMIVENTETGNTLRKNNLAIIDTIMESEGCLIANKNSLVGEKGKIIEGIRDLFEKGLD